MQITGLNRTSKIEFGSNTIHFVASHQQVWRNTETGRIVTLQMGQAINERTMEVCNGFFLIRINSLAIWAGSTSDFLPFKLVGRDIYSGLRGVCRLLAGSSREGNKASLMIDRYVPQASSLGYVMGRPLGRDAWHFRNTVVYPELAHEVVKYNV